MRDASSGVFIAGYGLFSPEYPSARAWLDREPTAEPREPEGALIDRRTRRRTSVFTRALADAYAEALAMAGRSPGEVASVFGSALGEAATMIGILDQIYGSQQPVSPLRFAMSVHNAAAGVISTTTGHQGFTTSIAADFDTPAMSLIEAIGLVATTGEAVAVICGDEQAPKDLVDSPAAGWDLLAVSVVLVPAEDSGTMAHISVPELSAAHPACGDGSEAPPRLSRNPQMGLLDLVEVVARRRTNRVVRLDRGRGRGYVVEVH